MEEVEKFSQVEFDAIYNDLKRCAIEEAYTGDSPKAIILGGQPGAGKSSLITRLKMGQNEKAVVISGDDFRKEHPHFDKLYAEYGDGYVNHTQKFSSQVTERLIDELSREKYNLIIEGTLRTSAVPLMTAELLKNRGYHVELAVMAVPPILSYVGTIERYEKMKEIGTTPRMTTKMQHDNTVNSIVNSIREVYAAGVFDDILLYNRKSECLYCRKNTPEVNPGDVLIREHTRNITPEESNYLDNVVEYIEKRWKNNPDKSIDNKELLFEMHSQVAQAQFKADLCENGFKPTDEIMAHFCDLVKNTGKMWKLEKIAEAYKSGGEVDCEIKNIGRQLENQQIVRDMEIQPEL